MHNMYYLAIIWGGVFISYFLAGPTKLTPVLFFPGLWFSDGQFGNPSP